MSFYGSGRGAVRDARRPSTIDVKPVPGEITIDNNKASYPVIFSLAVDPSLGVVHVTATTALIVALVGVRRRRWPGSGSRCVGLDPVRRVRDAQRSLLGGGRRISSTSPSRCRAASTTSTARSTRSLPGLARVDRRIDGTVTNMAIVRYDAYEDTGGHQSASLALLDSARTGLIVTAIQGRDYARIYMKELERGRASVALSPEEQEAVERAMGR